MAIIVVLISLAGMDPACGLQNVTADVARNRLCSAESWVTITQLWINIGIIYIAAIDRELLVDLLRPIFLVLSSVAAAMGKPDLARMFDSLSRGSEARDAKGDPVRVAESAETVAEARPKQPSTLVQRLHPKHATTSFVALNAVAIIICLLAALMIGLRPPQKQVPDVPPPPPGKETQEDGPPYPIQLPPKTLCWNAAYACTGSGKRWTELKAVNPDLRVEDQICFVQGRDILNVPASWQCPATWRSSK